MYIVLLEKIANMSSIDDVRTVAFLIVHEYFKRVISQEEFDELMELLEYERSYNLRFKW